MITSCYLTLRRGKVAKTKTLVRDTVAADYDKDGQLLGVEILADGPIEFICRTAGNIPNAETRKAMQDVRAGKNLTTYKDTDEMLDDVLGPDWRVK